MADPVIKAILEIQTRMKDLQKGVDGLKQAKEQTKKAKDELKGAEKAAASFGRTLQRWFGGLILFRFITGSIQKFADYQRALTATSVEARRLGLDQDQLTRYTKNLVEGIESSTGILRTETVPIFNKFLGLTEDAQVATTLLSAAVGAQEGKYNDVRTAANLLGSVLLGEVIEPAKSLGITLDNTKSSAENNAIVMDALLEKYLGLSGGIDDLRGALDGANANLNDVQITIGEQLAPAVEFLTGLFSGAIKVVQTWGAWLGAMIDLGIQQMTGLGKVIRAALNFRLLASDSKEYFAQLIIAQHEASADVTSSVAAAVEETVAIWKSGADQQKQTEEDLAASIAKIRALTSARGEVEDEKRRKEQAEKDRQAAKERLDFERRIADERLRLEIEAAQEGTQKRLALELEMLARLRQRALEEARLRGADEEKVNKLFDSMELARKAEHYKNLADLREQSAENVAELVEEVERGLKETEVEIAKEGSQEKLDAILGRLEAEKEAEIQKILDVLEAEILAAEARGEDTTELRQAAEELILKTEEKYAKKRLKAETDYTKAAEELSKTLRLSKMEDIASVASQAIALGRQLFGENKALGIAQAIIDTWIGVNRALTDPGGPAGIALAAIVAAMGLANVAKIASTSPGGGGGQATGTVGTASGFDDPVNDRLAGVAGRRWAEDMLRMVQSGMYDRLALAGPIVGPDAAVGIRESTFPSVIGGSTADELDGMDGGASVNINGPVFGGAPGIRRMVRMLRRVDQRDRRRRRL